MIHWLVTFTDDASQSPLAQGLRDLGVEHRLIAGKVLMRDRHRVWLILIGLPRLLRFGLKAAWRSLIAESIRPDAVIVGSHFEAAIFALAVRLLRRKTRVYLLGFIFTGRSNPWLHRARRWYFDRLFRAIDGVLCHSSLEVGRYDGLFPGARGKFTFVPYGLHIAGHEEAGAFVEPTAAPALSAGRSGRDYALLTEVFAKRGWPLRIVCDSQAALANVRPSPSTIILRQCYDSQYVAELRQAGMVVVPLSVDDISAGQMVAIQAMAYGKPLIITDTPTVREYVSDGVDALVVAASDSSALEHAVMRIKTEDHLAHRLAEGARMRYREHHSMRAFVANVVRAVQAAESARV